MGKYLNDKTTSIEDSIVHLLLTNKILDYYTIFKESTQKGDDFEKILKSIIIYYKDNHIYAMERIKDIMQFLKVAVDEEQYYFSYTVLMAQDKLLIKREDFDRLNHHFTLPQEIIDMVQSRKFIRKSVKYLRKLLDFDYEAYYLPIDFNTRLNSDFENTIDKLEQFIRKDVLDKQLQDNFVPSSFKAKIEHIPFDEYLEYVSQLKRLESLEKSQFKKLQATYYMPKVDTDIQEFKAFASKIGFVNDLMVEGLLIEKATLKTLSDFIPQDIQESIKKGEYDHNTAQRIERLKKFDMENYTLPNNFTTQIQNNFSKVIDNLDVFMPKELYKSAFIPKRLNELLL